MKHINQSLAFTCISLLALSGCTGQPVVTHTNEHDERVIAEFNAQIGSERVCANAYVKDYQDSLFEHCEATHGGDNIGGGCDHVAYAWSITTELLERSIQHCTKAMEGK